MDDSKKDSSLPAASPAGENEFVYISNDNFSPEIEALLRRTYDEVYAPIFPANAGGENVERWIESFKRREMVSEYRIIIGGRDLTAAIRGDADAHPVPKAITVSNYYPKSDTAILGYITVKPEFRTERLGMKILDLQADFLRAAANEQGQNLRGWFLACHDPAKTDHNYGNYSAQKLVDKYLQHGLKIVPVDYVQPATGDAEGTAADKTRYYMLMAAPHPETGEFPDAEATIDFLRSVYRDLGFTDPDSDPDMQSMIRQLRGEMPTVATIAAPKFPGP
ncbi:MAG TPA: hypothetical protein VL625_10635 [Patescibacteria group bacterium]|jgi:hypothetical protein|nr:hypothetical protein [Patescibacteria group bacterium]